MARITLKNNLEGKDVKVREGNAGVTRELATLKPGKSFVIHNDPNATYREYIIITLPDKTRLRVLTSDDFAEFREISIFEEGGKDGNCFKDDSPSSRGCGRRSDWTNQAISP